MSREVRNMNHPKCAFPAKIKSGDNLPSYFGYPAINKHTFMSYLLTSDFSSFHILVLMSLLKMATEQSVQCCLLFLITKGCVVPY